MLECIIICSMTRYRKYLGLPFCITWLMFLFNVKTPYRNKFCSLPLGYKGNLKFYTEELIGKFTPKCIMCAYTIKVLYKQEAHGPHCSPERPVQINKHICSKLWLYHKCWFGEGKTHHLLYDDWMVLICKNLSPLHPRMLCAKFG